MDVQGVEIPPKGTEAVTIQFTDRRGRVKTLFGSARRAFGSPYSAHFLAYPLRNPFKEQSETEELERLDRPLDPQEEKKQLVLSVPSDREEDQKQTSAEKKEKASQDLSKKEDALKRPIEVEKASEEQTKESKRQRIF